MSWSEAIVTIILILTVGFAFCWWLYVINRYTDEDDDE